MPRLERKTEMRGRSALPCTLARTRRRRLSRLAGLVMTVMRVHLPCLTRSCPLTDLPGHVLAFVADALALVRLGLALLADQSRDLAHLLLGGAADDDSGGLRDLEVDPIGRLDRDRVR